jgi:kinesin family protein 6/9
MNEDIDPNLLIGRLKQEISRLKAELAIARGEANGFPDGLPDYEKEKVHLAVCDYVKNNDSAAELLFSDFAKIQHAFYVMKNLILDKGTELRDNQTDTIPFESKPAGLSMDKYERMKMLIEHRDNEISKTQINRHFSYHYRTIKEKTQRKIGRC